MLASKVFRARLEVNGTRGSTHSRAKCLPTLYLVSFWRNTAAGWRAGHVETAPGARSSRGPDEQQSATTKHRQRVVRRRSSLVVDELTPWDT